MSERDVLIAAAGLRTFDAAGVAAYCTEDEQDVEAILAGHADLFRRQPRPRHAAGGTRARWQVVDDARLRQVIADGAPPVVVDDERDGEPALLADGLETRLFQAEFDLLSIPDEPDARGRRLKAQTAHNYLLQCTAAIQDGPDSDWWSVTPHRRLLPPRLRATLTLAELTLSELDGVSSLTQRELLTIVDDVIALAADNSGPGGVRLLFRLRSVIAELAPELDPRPARTRLDLPRDPPPRSVQLPHQRTVDDDTEL